MPASKSKKPKGNISKAKIVQVTRGEKKNFRWASASRDTLQAVRNLETYSNPTYDDTELEYFENAWRKSPAGTAVDKKIEFVIGKGVRPSFELIDEKDFTDEQKQKELEKYDIYLDELEQIDQKLGFKQKLYDAAVMAKVFGRTCLIWEEGKSKLPGPLKLIHPRDIGRVTINQTDWSLNSVLIYNPAAEIFPNDMIYFVNKPDSPVRKTILYGVSELERITGAARSWQRIIEYDMPEITTSLWANYGMFLVKKMGRNATDTDADLDAILERLKPGAFNAVAVDAVDDITYQTMDLEPKIAELVQLADYYERIMIGNMAVPEALLGREEAQTYATLLGKIRLFIEGPVEADREWLSGIISKQWYERNLKALGHEDILSQVRIKAEFEPIIVEKWEDVIDGVTKLKSLFPTLPDSVFLELLKLEQYEQDLDAQKKVQMESQDKQQLNAKRKQVESRAFMIKAQQYLDRVNKNKTT